MFSGSAMRCNPAGENTDLTVGAVRKQKNGPKIIMPAEAGSQEKQSLMGTRFRGNDAEWSFRDGPVYFARYNGWGLFISHGIGFPLTAEYESEKQHAPFFILSGIPSNR